MNFKWWFAKSGCFYFHHLHWLSWSFLQLLFPPFFSVLLLLYILFASNVYPIYLTWHVWRDIDVSTDKDEKEILFWSLIFRLAKKYIGINKYPEILLYLNLLYYYTSTMSIWHWLSMTRLWSRDKCKDNCAYFPCKPERSVTTATN